MPCYSPLKGYRSAIRNPSGKRSIVFNSREGHGDQRLELPCGQCIGCRLERSRKWAVRMVHESKLYEENAFITLTYSPENLPSHGSLVVKHWQDFMKRLRKAHPERRIRFFHCGEYGERTRRPHYHGIIFNYWFSDCIPWKVVNGFQYYISPELSRLWPSGHSTVGAVTFESAAYVARYVTKKITGRAAEAHYEVLDTHTGEYVSLKPEYTTMSRRPGIGRGWFDKYRSDLYPSDFVILKGKRFSVPDFYDDQLEKEDPHAYAVVRARRQLRGAEHAEDRTVDRLRVRQKVHELQARKLKRSFEDED